MDTINNFQFRVTSFVKSPYLLISVLLGALFGFIGIFFSILFPFLVLAGLVLIPIIYSWMPHWVVKFGFSNFAKKLSILPFFNYKGKWLLEVESEHHHLGTWSGFKRFILEFFKYIALPMVVIRTYLSNFLSTILNQPQNLVSSDILIFWTIYLIPLLIFVLVFTMKDIELKLVKTYEDGSINKLQDNSFTLIGLIAVVFGTGAVAKVSQYNLVEFFLIALFVEMGLPFFMCIIYYQTPIYQNSVNKIRNYLLKHHEELDIIIGSSEYVDLFCNRCDNINKYPNYFCVVCGNDLSQLSTNFISDPIIIGTMGIVPAKADEIQPADIERITKGYYVLVGFFIALAIAWIPFIVTVLNAIFNS